MYLLIVWYGEPPVSKADIMHFIAREMARCKSSESNKHESDTCHEYDLTRRLVISTQNILSNNVLLLS